MAEEAKPASDPHDEAPATPAAPCEPSAAPSTPVLREDQIQNAVAFLSHPKVRSSSESSKRSFLERKGLTAAEMDEAFRRVPQEPASTSAAATGAAPAAATAYAAPSAALQTTLQHIQPSPQPQYIYAAQQQPGAGVPGQQLALVPAQQAQVQQQEPQGVRWTQAALGAGFLAAGAYAMKALIWPYVYDAYTGWQGIVPSREAGKDEAVAASAAAVEATKAVAEAIAAQTAELRSSIESLQQLVEGLQSSRAEEIARTAAREVEGAEQGTAVAELREELRSVSATLREVVKLKDGKTDGSAVVPGRLESELSEIKQLLAQALRSSSPGAAFKTPTANGTAAVWGPQDVEGEGQGSSGQESPRSVYSVAEPHPTATPAPAAGEPEELGSPRSSAGAGTPAAAAAQGGGSPAVAEVAAATAATGAPEVEGERSGTPSPPPHPASYMEVLEMLQRGETPPGIRTDIVDTPPDPSAQPPESRLKPRPKPWEQRNGTSASTGASGEAKPWERHTSSTAGSSSVSGPASAVSGTAGGADSRDSGVDFGSEVGVRERMLQADGSASAGDSGSAARSAGPVATPSEEQPVAPPPFTKDGSGDEQGESGPAADQPAAAPASTSPTATDFSSSKRPAGFYSHRSEGLRDALSTDAVDSPGIIAGRLSPALPAVSPPASASGGSAALQGLDARTDGPGSTAVEGSTAWETGGPVGSSARAGAGLSTGVGNLGAGAGGSSTSGTGGNPSSAHPGTRSPGGGMGRPASASWRPPPIPAPLISSAVASHMYGPGGSSAGKTIPDSSTSAGVGDADGVRDGDDVGEDGSVVAEQGEAAGRSGRESAGSLGADFAGT